MVSNCHTRYSQTSTAYYIALLAKQVSAPKAETLTSMKLLSCRIGTSVSVVVAAIPEGAAAKYFSSTTE